MMMIGHSRNPQTKAFFTIQWRKRQIYQTEFGEPFFHSGESFENLDDAVDRLESLVAQYERGGAEVNHCYGTQKTWRFPDGHCIFSAKVIAEVVTL